MKTSTRLGFLVVLLLAVAAISYFTYVPKGWPLRGQRPTGMRYYTTDVPLEQAVREFNERAVNDPIGNTQPPLTADEVVANIRAWNRAEHPVSDKVYEVFQRIARTQVMPRGSAIGQINRWSGQNGYDYTVWWVDVSVNNHLWDEPDKYVAYSNGGGMVIRVRSVLLDSKPMEPRKTEPPSPEAQKAMERLAEIRKAAAARRTERTGAATMTREEYQEYVELMRKLHPPEVYTP